MSYIILIEKNKDNFQGEKNENFLFFYMDHFCSLI